MSDTQYLPIWGAIGREYKDGIGAKDVADQLDAMPASTRRIVVSIHSPGGNPFDGVAINARLTAERQKGRTVEVEIPALSASAATIIHVAGAPIRVGQDALVMIHNPWTFTMGDAPEHRAAASQLDAVTDAMIGLYVRATKRRESEIRAWLDATTWMDGAEAVANGFATEVIPAASNQIAAMAFAPEVLARLGAPPPKHRRQFDAVARVAGARLNPTAIYDDRNRPRAFEPQATARAARPRSIAAIASRYYDDQAAETAAGAIGTSPRGGAR
ncbi:MAG: Clp protease ClpP [Vicinamibacterales bacterium]|nr:Clp protease ClpP [Vicinamibacterales bacterium]